MTLKECQKNGQDAVEFCVQDTGLGIPAEYHDAVFSENGKLHRKMMKNDNIMCLGLPIVKELVAMHGGSIEMQSKLGEGSMFTVYLPQHKPN